MRFVKSAKKNAKIEETLQIRTLFYINSVLFLCVLANYNKTR